ncbi:MAG: hypothetical protein DME18_03025 [Verrucomicrobia bacterium]|nr:MAG: hypothetical protein DME18_03025 [Verrucomicrobiota bacterium]
MNSSLKFVPHCFLSMLASLAVALLTGCRTPQYSFPDAESTNSAPASPVSASGGQTNSASQAGLGPELLRSGDRITIIFSGTTPLDKHEEQIREDGHVYPPLLGRAILAAGKTIGQLEDELQALYVPTYFKAATITVKRQESYFFVRGEVKKPGQIPYLSKMTATSAIAAAGDFTEFASRRNVEIIRINGRKEKVNCDKAIKNPKLDRPIYPGDQIIVHQRWF